LRGGRIVVKKQKAIVRAGMLSLGLISYLMFKNQPETIVLKENALENYPAPIDQIQKEDIYLITEDGLPLALTVFEPTEQPIKAVIQIVHGLLEHRLRYNHLASFLARHGFAVVVSDNRGHGDSVDSNNPLEQMPGVRRMVKDQLKITQLINERFANLPVYLYGHSYGSVIARLYLQENDQNIDKLLMTGTVQYEKKAKYGVVLALLADVFAGKGSYSWIIKKLSNFGSTDKTWLTNDPIEVEKASKDSRMLPGYNNLGVTTIWEGVRRLKDISLFTCQNPDLAIMSITGAEDKEITGGKSGLIDTRRTLRKIGYHDIEMLNFPGMKHEVINEINQDLVYQTMLEFFIK